MTQLVEVFIKLMIIMAVGFYFAKRGVITENVKTSLTTVLLNVILYFNILSSSQQEFSREFLTGLIETFAVCAVYYFIAIPLVLFLSRRLKLKSGLKEMFVIAAVFGNTGMIGYSVAGELIGSEGVLYGVAVNAVFGLFFYPYGMYLIKRGAGRKEKFNLNDLLKNTMLQFSLLAIVLYVLPWRFPEVVADTVSTIGGLMLPISMIVIGADIAGMKLSEILKDPISYLASFIRLIASPALVLLIAKLLSLPDNVVMALVIFAAMPTGTMASLTAREYGCSPDFASRAVGQSTVLMLATLPLMVMITRFVLPL